MASDDVEATGAELNRRLAALSAAQQAYTREVSLSMDSITHNPYYGTVVELCEDGVAPWGKACFLSRGMCDAPTATFDLYNAGLSAGHALGTQDSLGAALNACAADATCAAFANTQTGSYTLSGDAARLLTGANLEHAPAAGTQAYVKNSMVPSDSLKSVSTTRLGIPVQMEYVKLTDTRLLTSAQEAAGAAAPNPTPSLAVPTGSLSAETVNMLLASATNGRSVTTGPSGKGGAGWVMTPVASVAATGWTSYVAKASYDGLKRMGLDAALKQQCVAHYGTTQACCGQPGLADDPRYVCPASAPTCASYVYGSQWGHCVEDPPQTVVGWRATPSADTMRKACPVTCNAPCGNYYFVTPKGVVRPIAAGLGPCGKTPTRIHVDKHQFLAQNSFQLGPPVTAVSDCEVDPLEQPGRAAVTQAMAAVLALGTRIEERSASLRRQETATSVDIGSSGRRRQKAIIEYQRMERQVRAVARRSAVASQMSTDYLERAVSVSSWANVLLAATAVAIGSVVVAAATR